MSSIEERVAYLEGKVEEHSHGFGEVRDLIVQVQGDVRNLDHKVDRFREELAARIDAQGLRIDAQGARIDALDHKVDRFREELAACIDAQGLRIDAQGARIDALDQKISSQFVWIVGIQVTILLSVIGTLLLGMS